MAKKTLTRAVWVDDVLWRIGTTPPPEVAKKIANPDVWGEAAVVPSQQPGAVTITTGPTSTTVETDDEELAEFPDGDPDDTWSVKDMRAWAKANELTLGEAKAKPQILAKIAEHLGIQADDEGDLAAGTDESE